MTRPVDGMWIVAETATSATTVSFTLEWWPYRRGATGSGKALVILAADPPLGLEQWRLIKKQFENMGISPQGIAIAPHILNDKT